MRYYATIKVEQTYEIEADTLEQAESYFLNQGIGIPDDVVSCNPDWETLEVEEV
jgi:hypothetical protein